MNCKIFAEKRKIPLACCSHCHEEAEQGFDLIEIDLPGEGTYRLCCAVLREAEDQGKLAAILVQEAIGRDLAKSRESFIRRKLTP